MSTAEDDADKAWMLVQTLELEHTRTVRSTAWSPCGKRLACSSFDATVSIWKREEDGLLALDNTLEGHENEVKGVAWSPSGRYLATSSRDKTVWIWDSEDDFEIAGILNGHAADVKDVCWHPLEEILLSCSYDDTIRVWEEEQASDDWNCIDVLKSHDSTVWSVAFEKFPENESDESALVKRDRLNPRLVSCSADKSLIVWKKLPKSQGGDGKWKNTAKLSDHTSRTIYSVDWNSKNQIVSAGGDDAVRVFTEQPGEGGDDVNSTVWNCECCVEKAHATDVNCVQWNPVRPDLLLSCSDDRTVKLWRYEE
eukprot:TRINITY_DN86112_c0_g1_i1.p1 TRINITY_DN86112_c0_g1~~TRINITY_DN86112_c0_g1_i1.p1  ORF type:complete len:361 (+),score=28.88 TRINITY_DN86112_c0_g1_i1:155-1084(+)